MRTPDFSSWSRENLENLAVEMYVELQALRQDVKDAIEAYRNLNKTRGSTNEEINHSNECGK